MFVQQAMEMAAGRMQLAVQYVGGPEAWDRLVAETVAAGSADVAFGGWLLVGAVVVAVVSVVIQVFRMDEPWAIGLFVAGLIALCGFATLNGGMRKRDEPTAYLITKYSPPL